MTEQNTNQAVSSKTRTPFTDALTSTEAENVAADKAAKKAEAKAKRAAKAQAKKDAAKKDAEGKKITRIVSATRVLLSLKVDTSRDEILKKSDELYVVHGGKSNTKEALYGYRVASEVLRELGRISTPKPENVVISPISAKK